MSFSMNSLFHDLFPFEPQPVVQIIKPVRRCSHLNKIDTRFKIVIAVDQNWGIGKDGSIPWDDSTDRKRFAQLTKSGILNALIVGRKTFESMKNINLSNRKFYVIGSEPGMFKSFFDAVDAAEKECDEIWICGGKRVYLEALESPFLQGVYMTKINGSYDCDVDFLELESWIEKSCVTENGFYVSHK
jgi:dihydrofolate reductase